MGTHGQHKLSYKQLDRQHILFYKNNSRALRALAPGEEVTIAYVELAATRQERREALFEQYAFDINALWEGGGSGGRAVGDAGVANSGSTDDHGSCGANGGVGSSSSSGCGRDGISCVGGEKEGISIFVNEGKGDCTPDQHGAPRTAALSTGDERGAHKLQCKGSTNASTFAAHASHDRVHPHAKPPGTRQLKHTTLRPPAVAEHRKSGLGQHGLQRASTKHSGNSSGGLTAAGAGAHKSNTEPSSTELLTRVYSLHPTPPWPTDPNDAALTQLVLVPPPASHAPMPAPVRDPLPGGVHVLSLQLQPDQDPTESFGGAWVVHRRSRHAVKGRGSEGCLLRLEVYRMCEA